MFQQHSDDPRLLVFGRVRAGATLAGVLNGEVQWRRAALVHQFRIGTLHNEDPDRL